VAGFQVIKSGRFSVITEDYNDDIGIGTFGDLLISYRDAFVEPAYAAEMTAIATLLEVPVADVLMANFSYDALKVVLGCTAFAVETDVGPLHGRHLDWSTTNQLLARHTIVVNYRWGSELRFRVVGWPGYIGALSGMRPGAFAVTLNAVLGCDPPAMLPPVTLLLRTVLAEASTFASAVERLRCAPIASDCLLLVTGTEPGQMVVVERAPTRAALRHAEGGVLVVANDYRSLPMSAALPSSAPGPSSLAGCETARSTCRPSGTRSGRHGRRRTRGQL
jgi:acid ceramidase